MTTAMLKDKQLTKLLSRSRINCEICTLKRAFELNELNRSFPENRKHNNKDL